jgi:CheY-like chemotaxis protein
MTRRWNPDTSILVVEDDFATAKLYCARIGMEGLRAHPAENGFEALEILKREPISMIMTDLVMPAMDGYRLIQELRQLPPPVNRVPVLVISSSHNEQDMVRCLAAGANDYITKPFSFPVLMERLWKLAEHD